MNSIRDRGEFVAAITQPRAFLFLWVDWAVHARQSRAVVEQVVMAWLSDYPDQPVPCYVVDVSEQRGEVWDVLCEWLTIERLEVSLFVMSGAGPLIWVQAGRVVHQVLSPLHSSAAILAAVSRRVFKMAAESGDAGDAGDMS